MASDSCANSDKLAKIIEKADELEQNGPVRKAALKYAEKLVNATEAKAELAAQNTELVTEVEKLATKVEDSKGPGTWLPTTWSLHLRFLRTMVQACLHTRNCSA
mmetsp:Transcript_4086/g.8913  ORF Transcript_4086/g.8913 Transcript_4086/m.8913 type:complete len:104 (-) Transcript_4086:356-667(-)